MKKIVLAVLSASVLAGCATHQPLPVQEQVNLDQYMGKWYEQTRLPNRFQKQCVAEVSAEYERLNDETISVVNQCVTANGEKTTATALGRVDASQPEPNPAILEVRFAPAWLSWWPGVWGDYWIMRVVGDYEYSLVGTPDRKYLWILSRAAQGDPAIIQDLLEYAAEQGFDIDDVMYTTP